MKLYTFLLIDDAVKYSLFTPRNVHEEPDYEDTTKNNRIYFYKGMPEIAFMSYRYTNVKIDVLDNPKCKPKWAYVIIDNDKEIIENIKSRKNWSIDKDKKVKEMNYIETNSFLTIDTGTGMRCFKFPQYKRFGGHLGAGRAGIRADTLHELVLITKYGSFNYIEKKYIEENMNRTANGVEKIIDVKRKVVIDAKGKEIEDPRVHHKGHTFDDRIQYLMPISEDDHEDIHKLEIDMQFAYRPKYISYEENYSTTLQCDCDDKGKSCKLCNAVLQINTNQQFFDFIESLRSKEYKLLERRHIYDELTMNKE